MNRLRRILFSIGIAMLSFCLSLICLTACGGEDPGKKVVFTFNTNGGVAISNVEKPEGSEYSLPIPQREGYSFEGWYTNENFEGEVVTSVTATVDATYYAKWAKLYAITLELNDGTLEGAETLTLKEGANVYDFMQSYVPTKDGLVFGAWFNGDMALSTSATITSDITLHAKYKVEYTVEIYEQELKEDGTLGDYVKSEASFTDYAYVGEEFISEQALTGFDKAQNDNTVDKLTLDEDASKNVFKHYFDRRSFVVSFNANYPDGSSSTSISKTVIYGQEVDLLVDYVFEGYCLIGWATSASGEKVYESNYIQSALYNSDENDTVEETTFLPTRNTALYGVWLKGYADMFGNGDYIYILDEETEEAYLSRGGVFFKGEYRAENKEFRFMDSRDDILLEGKLNSESTYVYYDSARSKTAYSLLNAGVGLDEYKKIFFDEYDGVKYVDTTETPSKELGVGTYTIDEDGYYHATFSEGDLAGETFVFVIGYVTLTNGTNAPAFQLRNEKEYEIGKLVQYEIVNGKPTAMETNTLELTGFGFATMSMSNGLYPYYYTMSDTSITLIDYYYGTESTYQLVEIDGVLGYAVGNSLGGTYTLLGGYTLVLDGLYNATYKHKDGATVVGYYTYEASKFNGYIVTVYAGSATYKFLMTTHTVSLPDANGGSIEMKYTEVERKLASYCEYQYYADGKLYYSGLLTVNEDKEGEAILYGYVSNTKEYVKLSSGTLTLNEETGKYLYTATSFYETEEEVATEPKDFSLVTSFICALDSTTTQYNLYYVYSDEIDGEWTNYDVKYTSAKGGTLTVIKGFAVYEEDGFLIRGICSTQNNLLAVQSAQGNVYVEIDEDNKTFTSLQSLPYSAKFVKQDGYINSNERFDFDGKGGITYTVVTVTEGEGDEEDTKTETSYAGTYVEKGVTEFNYPIYEFTFANGERESFQFLMVYTSSAVYIMVYNETYNGEYLAEDGAMLTLDGFNFQAMYTNENGYDFEGIYSVSAENEITLETDYGTFYFDLTANKGFSVRGAEYGTYLVMDNQALNGWYLDFNGYDGVAVYTYEEVPAEGGEEGETDVKRVDIDANATYKLVGTDCTITYTKDGKPNVLIGSLAAFSDGQYIYNIFVISYEEAVQTFVNEKDWSVLTLDNLGNATKYTKNGSIEKGMYTLITENLLYYVNVAGTDACIFNYDVETKTITEIRFSPVAYYTKELDSLVFSQHGFAIFNAEEYYYYNIDENENVIIYRQAPGEEGANKYGFIAQSFGKQSEVKEWGEGDNKKTYYSNNGYAITFQRDANDTNYPVTIESEKYQLQDLVFTPNGEAEFAVSAYVTINGQQYKGTVVRKISEESGKAEMYLQIVNFRFDLELDYKGQTEEANNNTYKITRMRNVIEAEASMYLTLAQFLESWLGSGAASLIQNSYGKVTIVREYNTEGDQISELFTGEFGESSGLTDMLGNIISVKDVQFTIDKSGAYKVTLVAEDGYTYNLYIGLVENSYFGVYGYEVYAFTREQTFTVDTYTVTVERMLKTDQSFNLGSIFSLVVKKDGVEIEADAIYLPETGTAYYVVRTKDEDGLFTASTYYVVEFTEPTSGSIEGGNTVKYPAYESVKVTKYNVTTHYSENAISYIDVNENNEVLLLSYYGELKSVVSSEYDAQTNTYTVTTTNEIYTITFQEGVAVFEKENIPQEEEEA